ncbi:MAG: hypothetical protein ACFFB8_10830 [Promethearchaeota archaeon]
MVKINRTKIIPKIILGFVVLITIFGLTTSANAGIPPFMWNYMPDNVISWGIDLEVPQNEPSLYLCATACTDWEIETGFYPKPPFNHKVYIDGEKIVLRRCVFYDEEGYVFGIPETKWYVFYQIFEAGYFTLGEHNVIHEVYVQKPYAGSETYGWRIFVNYEGPEELYGEVEEPLIISYTLTFV